MWSFLEDLLSFSFCHFSYGEWNCRLQNTMGRKRTPVLKPLQKVCLGGKKKTTVFARYGVVMLLTSWEVTLPLTWLSAFSLFLLAWPLPHLSLISFLFFLINNGIFNSVDSERCHLGQLLFLPYPLSPTFSSAKLKGCETIRKKFSKEERRWDYMIIEIYEYRPKGCCVM